MRAFEVVASDDLAPPMFLTSSIKIIHMVSWTYGNTPQWTIVDHTIAPNLRTLQHCRANRHHCFWLYVAANSDETRRHIRRRHLNVQIADCKDIHVYLERMCGTQCKLHSAQNRAGCIAKEMLCRSRLLALPLASLFKSASNTRGGAGGFGEGPVGTTN